jgi:hypothetical protein
MPIAPAMPAAEHRDLHEFDHDRQRFERGKSDAMRAG